MSYAGKQLLVHSDPLHEERWTSTPGNQRSDNQDSDRLAAAGLRSVSGTPTPSSTGASGSLPLFPPSAAITFEGSSDAQGEIGDQERQLQEVMNDFETNRLNLQRICEDVGHDLQELTNKIRRCRAEHAALYKLLRQIQYVTSTRNGRAD
ncbi:hypothetical protein C8T65DRAFT_744429 [Cerioporus squamosus]|nr:hypothetical protein C8T65DRAFT_744429 [Cerioporus squamosus]